MSVMASPVRRLAIPRSLDRSGSPRHEIFEATLSDGIGCCSAAVSRGMDGTSGFRTLLNPHWPQASAHAILSTPSADQRNVQRIYNLLAGCTRLRRSPTNHDAGPTYRILLAACTPTSVRPSVRTMGPDCGGRGHHARTRDHPSTTTQRPPRKRPTYRPPG